MGLGVVTSGSLTVVTGWVSDLVSDRTLLTVPAFLSMGAGSLIIAYVPTIDRGAARRAIVLVGGGMGAAAPAMLSRSWAISRPATNSAGWAVPIR